tara:strand:+ start:1958 stop:2224 length:267 start_codon:yes stop_codon:yes gene_type:complete
MLMKGNYLENNILKRSARIDLKYRRTRKNSKKMEQYENNSNNAKIVYDHSSFGGVSLFCCERSSTRSEGCHVTGDPCGDRCLSQKFID